MEKRFDGDIDFFKSFEQEENGMLKSIPTVEKKTVTKKITVTNGKSVPKAVEQFKKKIEGAFKEIDSVVKDLAAKDMIGYQNDKFICMASSYKKFKEDFKYLVNDCINYPRTKDTESTEVSEWDKSRIRI